MKTLFPDYDNGLVNVMSSILKYFNIYHKHKSLGKLDDVLKKKPKNVVLVLFDGLGYNILKRNEKYCPFLNEYLIGDISSCFPTTTMSARTTVESGLCPIEHGWLGWDMYFKCYDKVITLARNYVKGTKEKITDYNIAKTLLKYDDVLKTISPYISWIAPIKVYPGEYEQEALALNALKVLRGEKKALKYEGKAIAINL